MIWLLAIPAVLLVGLLVVDWQISAPGYKGPKSDHFNGRKFFNPDKVRGRGLFDLAKWSFSSDRGEWSYFQEHEVDVGVPRQQPESSEMVVTFINHTTFLIQTDGVNILTDPIWSDRASPYTWIGPKRMRPPGVRFEDLPDIDLVLLSHNHYDHLDLPTVLRLKATHDPLFITPLGVDQYLKQHHITQTVDLDWWKQHIFNDEIEITGIPAQHFSGRGVFDRDQTLWCGYVLRTPNYTLYFAGDTAYGSFFTDIGEAFDIDLSIIPIGAYKPRWFMESIHVGPTEAVQIHQDVRSKYSLASHFGTFPLADEGMDEPPKDLLKALKKAGLSSDVFRALNEGESYHYLSKKTRMNIARN
ncbi:MAG TPA: MBL fold metallo-hydrolase [Balneolaceae bacterium]|nr:MBL fold metallo-hydrolase [Balneolaceae bacterium]